MECAVCYTYGENNVFIDTKVFLLLFAVVVLLSLLRFQHCKVVLKVSQIFFRS